MATDREHELERQLQDARSANENSQLQVDQLRFENENQQAEITQLRTNNDDLRGQILQLELRMMQPHHGIAAAEEAPTRLSLTFASDRDLLKEISRLQVRVTGLSNEVTNLRGTKEYLSARVSELEAEIDAQREKDD